MNPSSSLLLAALLSASASAAGEDLFLRGGFNGWGTDHALVHQGKGIYEARVLLSPGNHPFKVGSKDWSSEWVVNPARSVAVTPGAAYRMATQAGPEGFLFVCKTAEYRFSVDVSNPAAPLLRVTRIDAPAATTANPHLGHAQKSARRYATFDGKGETVTFSSPDAGAALRSYAQSTTAQLRDPGPQFATYKEYADLPRVRTGSLGFDALFALAGAEMKQNSVSNIRDGNYNGGAAIPCECFETGEKWHYVWTRDLSYAADLGLAMLDPQRVRNSLDFKLSGFRNGIAKAPQVAGSADGLQIIQDTGSGGSWPVSTDRVTWAFGAEQVLKTLPANERKAFAQRALAALVNTIENDRIAAFDTAAGLYTGEQSFLDWRDQSYAAWIVDDLASMASAKALSTNVGHYKALSLAASLAREHGDSALAAKYMGWAQQLKRAINSRLWMEDEGMYSSLTAAHFNGAPMHKFDWLGQSLAIVTGVADEAQAKKILARYPHGPMGAPVIYPQQQDLPVYHNRAIWPFVTAYGLKAAAQGGNVSVADAAYDTLMRGAALNLSNMENLEWISGQPLLLDEKNPSLIGPVINSKRQLWSVGAYFGMVIENVFGVTTTSDGISVRPFITAKLAREVFGANKVIELQALRLHGKTVSVRVHLPRSAAGVGYYGIASVALNGAAAGRTLAWDKLGTDNLIDVTLGQLLAGEQAIRRVNANPYSEAPSVFGPREPSISALSRNAAGQASLTIAPARGAAPTVYNVYRDGQLLASGVKAGVWTDRKAGDASCYAVEAQFAKSGNRSHHSRARCLDGGIEIAAKELKGWGKPSDALKLDAITVPQAGSYQIQVRYLNRANEINLGVSGGVKWLQLKDQAGTVVAQGVVQMPHARSKTAPVYSTPVAAQLAAGRYQLQLSDFYNMSYLEANSSFSAAGGTSGPSNIVDLYGARLLRVRQGF